MDSAMKTISIHFLLKLKKEIDKSISIPSIFEAILFLHVYLIEYIQLGPTKTAENPFYEAK